MVLEKEKEIFPGVNNELDTNILKQAKRITVRADERLPVISWHTSLKKPTALCQQSTFNDQYLSTTTASVPVQLRYISLVNLHSKWHLPSSSQSTTRAKSIQSSLFARYVVLCTQKYRGICVVWFRRIQNVLLSKRLLDGLSAILLLMLFKFKFHRHNGTDLGRTTCCMRYVDGMPTIRIVSCKLNLSRTTQKVVGVWDIL